MTFSLGFSPCPNDTFIFDALVNGKIDTGDLHFKPVLEDIQTLNEWSDTGRLDITKLSFPAYFRNQHNYRMLHSGAALGKGVGPLLIARNLVNLPDIKNCSIAIPGHYTTANFLLNFAFPEATNRTPMLFSEIEDAVLMGKFDLGVIIHENRFTYQQKGLLKVCDLGAVWEEKQHVPIPLACIAAKNTITPEIAERISALIKKSIEFAFANYPEITDYTREHSQAMEEDVMRKHIKLYVNNFSLDLGEEGLGAIERLAAINQALVSTA